MNYRALAQHLSKTCRKRLDAFKSPADVSSSMISDGQFVVVVGEPIKNTDRERHENTYSFGIFAVAMDKGTRRIRWHFYVIVSEHRDVLVEPSVGKPPDWVRACLRKSYDEAL